jgi:DNA-directed RNA polymerase subunit N (RpoN/RPB10)
MACCAWKLPRVSDQYFCGAVIVHSRALLSSEALEKHLCVAVDAEVLDGLGVLRRACRILSGSGFRERRAQGVSESLHRG